MRFNIGDVIKLSEEGFKECSPGFKFRGTAIFRGLDTSAPTPKKRAETEYFALERTDGVFGGAQNGWWCFPKHEIQFFTLVEPTESFVKKYFREVQPKYL